MKIKAVFAALCALTLASGGASAATYTANNLGLIVDNGWNSHTFEVTDTGTITGLEISVGFSTCGSSFKSATGSCKSSWRAPFNNELGLKLTSASGTSVNLITPGTYGVFGVGSYVVDFSDSAASALGSIPQSGAFRPVQSLSDLIGEDPLGYWKLWIQDTVSADPKRLDSFTLSFTTAPLPVPVPLPAAMPMLLAGLGGLAMLRRRRKRPA